MNSGKRYQISDQDRLDIFIDFLGSAEWIFPVQSFIDYYCVVFATEDRQEHFQEKQCVYNEYKSIVGSNLNNFISSVLEMDGAAVVALMALYQGDYTCLEYVLAVEDYEIFHTFMYETNKDLDQQVKYEKQKKNPQVALLSQDEELIAMMRETKNEWGKLQKTTTSSVFNKRMTDDEQIKEAIRQSKTPSQNAQKSNKKTDEDQLEEAIRQSKLDAENTAAKLKSLKLSEEEELNQVLLLSKSLSFQSKQVADNEEDELQRAIRMSEESERERLQKLERENQQKLKKQKAESKRQELRESQRNMQDELTRTYQNLSTALREEEQKAFIKVEEENKAIQRIQEEQEAIKRMQEEQDLRRQLMLQQLKEQTENARKEQELKKQIELQQLHKAKKELELAQVQHYGSNRPLNAPAKVAEQQSQLPKITQPTTAASDWAQNLTIDKDQPKESIEERKKRLQTNRDALKKKQQHGVSTVPQPEITKVAEKDVFRRTGMKFGESESEKQARLKRCMNVLKQVNTGQASQFKPLVGVDKDPRSYQFIRSESDEEDSNDITDADLTVLDYGKKNRYD